MSSSFRRQLRLSMADTSSSMLKSPRKPDVAYGGGAMGAIDPFPPADPLGEALHLLRMNGAFYCRSELTAPWGLTLPPMPGYLWFHVVTSGAANRALPRLESWTSNESW